jgi:ketosteroid isomerase-like protein
MLRIVNPQVARRTLILRGYGAFNAGDWPALQALLSANVVWHPMDGGEAIRGRDKVMAHLKALRKTTEAEFLSMVSHDDAAITVDFTHTSRKEGDHACADKILFEKSGRIKEVWHCAAATHQHGHAGHPATPGHAHSHS